MIAIVLNLSRHQELTAYLYPNWLMPVPTLGSRKTRLDGESVHIHSYLLHYLIL